MSAAPQFAGLSSETKLAVDPTKPLLYSSPEFHTYRHGFRQPIDKLQGPAVQPLAEGEEPASYQPPKAVPELTAIKENEHGVFVENTYPELLSGTNAPQGPPKWWKKESEVDVLICGGGPSGLQVAMSLARQGISFRIVDKSDGPLISGRADSAQPRFLETISQWGLSTEITEDGPLIERTAVWKDGRNLVFGNSHQSDSRYRGLHVTTQPVVEQVYLRDLLRHRAIVERLTSVKEFTIDEDDSAEYPVSVTLTNVKSGETEQIRCKYLVGADGGSSVIRKQIGIKFDGVSTNIYWGIMDAVYETTYPHAGVFGCVVNSKYGGCVIIPREDGMIRLYTQIDNNRVVGKDRLDEGGAMDIGSITPEEVLAQANRIFAPFTIKFASPLHWFSVWKISERVAERFSYKDRVHLVGDACHVHSVMGAFGLNASILDSANVAWKMGMCIKGLADPAKLMPTYEAERRRHAARIIETSGTYLRFVCASDVPVVKLGGVGMDPREEEAERNEHLTKHLAVHKDVEDVDKKFLREFYTKNGGFLLGVDCEYAHNNLNPPQKAQGPQAQYALSRPIEEATEVRWGVRTPNPRVTFDQNRVGYLYDACGTVEQFTLVIFGSDLQGPIAKSLKAFESHIAQPGSFFQRFKAANLFKLVLLTKFLPLDYEEYFAEHPEELKFLRENSTLIWDDQLPKKDAHNAFGVNHRKGAVVVVRPDMWTGISVLPTDADILDEYFDRFLISPA